MNGHDIKGETFRDHNKVVLPHKKYLNLTECEKVKEIEWRFRGIMEVLGLDLANDSLKDTPERVARMYVNEIFQGLNDEYFPMIRLFDNRDGYSEMLIIKEIQVFSFCEHHFLPFIGKAHIAYFPREKVIGLSKFNRIVRFFSRRPQLQERLTKEIAESVKDILLNEDVAVLIEAKHLCVAARGIEDTKSLTVTSHYSGRFSNEENRVRFLNSLS